MAATKDAVLDSAVELARRAAEEVAQDPALVGEHLGLEREGERLVAHRFATTAPGYVGWAWTVTLARVPRGRTPTVCEVDLLPGDGALLPPPWVPWAERLRPGDLGPGDVLPFQADDERLDQGYEATGDLDADQLALFELGLGRSRVLSAAGRSQAADRWYAGSHGPMAPTALGADAPCSTCGFLVLLAGSLRTEFGVCANEWSPEDGRVVSMDHGCGAHSETDASAAPTDWPDPVTDADELDLVGLDESGGDEPGQDEPGADEQDEPGAGEAGPQEPADRSEGHDEPGELSGDQE
ncbi:DUF3027 domain-containing protein [Isoptericola sp. b490]|uniref:DUF3027 domain-containing protein n=1 Tax=Actinotalea lenta TaxID=3064654 RepID=UPI0027123FBC|nr:DUF3027 domain-containing protein [Isoptericola sp. b490]MDO8121627.1 DUF3027 domain-containing protein [Isoptericola sp. b490]